MNCVQMMGYMTRDPELRYTTAGKGVVTGAVAINRKWTDDAGQAKEDVSFFDWTAFGRTGEIINQYLKKGDPFLFEGRLQQQRWNDKHDQKPRSKVVIIVERMTFVPSRKQRDDHQGAATPATPAPQLGLPSPKLPASVPCDSSGRPLEEDDCPY